MRSAESALSKELGTYAHKVPGLALGLQEGCACLCVTGAGARSRWPCSRLLASPRQRRRQRRTTRRLLLILRLCSQHCLPLARHGTAQARWQAGRSCLHLCQIQLCICGLTSRGVRLLPLHPHAQSSCCCEHRTRSHNWAWPWPQHHCLPSILCEKNPPCCQLLMVNTLNVAQWCLTDALCAGSMHLLPHAQDNV